MGARGGGWGVVVAFLTARRGGKPGRKAGELVGEAGGGKGGSRRTRLTRLKVGEEENQFRDFLRERPGAGPKDFRGDNPHLDARLTTCF